MFQEWISGAERIAFAAIADNKRVIGLTAPMPGSGVSEVCAHLAAVIGRSGKKVLLVDFCRAPEELTEGEFWVPGEEGAEIHIRKDSLGFDRLVANYRRQDSFLFSNVARLRWTFRDELSAYDVIIADMPVVPPHQSDRINGIAVASACDAVMLVCLSGRLTRSLLRQSVDALKGADVTISAAILNDMYFPTLGAEIARQTTRINRFLPRFANWIKRRALASPFLN